MTNIFINSPLEQFEIQNFIGIDAPILGYLEISLTNFGFYFILAFLLVLSLNLLANNNNKIVPNHWSISQESIYATLHNIVTSQIGGVKGQFYLPFIYSLFMLILISNYLGMIPYSFAVTSHLVFTLSLSFTILIGVTIIGFQEHGMKFFSFLCPPGTPVGLVPLLVLIELISYLARGLSLGLRLGANIMAGHMLLKIIAGFIYNIMASSVVFFILGLIPLALLVAITGLEFAVAAIQAYVFTVLTCSYIKDAIDLH